MGNGIAGLLGRAQPANLGAYTRFGGMPQSFGGMPLSIQGLLSPGLLSHGLGQQIPTQQPQQPFPTYGQYGLLAAQMAQRPQQQMNPGGMPPSNAHLTTG